MSAMTIATIDRQRIVLLMVMAVLALFLLVLSRAPPKFSAPHPFP